MVNGVTFGEKHSFRDYGLILNERPKIGSPQVKTNYIDNPGGDGKIDATESLDGDVKFDDRALEFVFITRRSRKTWANLYSKLLEELHGQEMKMILDEDPDYYYFGRIFINEWKSSKKYSTIVVETEVEPYKYEKFSSLEDWEWDSFNFESGIIREYKDLEVDGTLTLVIDGLRKKVIPEFEVSNAAEGIQVEFNGERFDLPEGKSRILDITIKQGENTLKFLGKGTVSVGYRGGRL